MPLIDVESVVYRRLVDAPLCERAAIVLTREVNLFALWIERLGGSREECIRIITTGREDAIEAAVQLAAACRADRHHIAALWQDQTGRPWDRSAGAGAGPEAEAPAGPWPVEFVSCANAERITGLTFRWVEKPGRWEGFHPINENMLMVTVPKHERP
jgi:hypothetical protein